KDLHAWIDLEVFVTSALNSQDIHTLRRQRERLINIRPVFPETKQIVAEARAKLPIDELFRKFYQERTGGAEPEQELVSLFLTLLDSDDCQRPKVEDEKGEIA
ncbi:MAG: exonuclease sbcCD subunit D, partial [Desulfosporosinus sp.]